MGQLAYFIEKGKIDNSGTIQIKDLVNSGVVSSVKDGIKILGKGVEKFKALDVKLDLEVSDAS